MLEAQAEEISEVFPADALLRQPFLWAFLYGHVSSISIAVLASSLPAAPSSSSSSSTRLGAPPQAHRHLHLPTSSRYITHFLLAVSVTRGFDNCLFVVLKKGSGDQLTQLN